MVGLRSSDQMPDWVTGEDWSGLIVVCSGTAWTGPRLSDRHLAERLVRYAPVLYVDPPISVLTPLRRPEMRGVLSEPRLTRIGDGLLRLTPVAPPGVSRPGLRTLAMAATRAAMHRTVRRLGGDVEAVIVGSLDDLFGACGERQRVLWGTDDFATAGALMGVSPSWLARLETRALSRADVIVTVSEDLAHSWRAKSGKPVTVIANGCDAEHFAAVDTAPPPMDVHLPQPIAAFVGHLSERIDVAYLQAVADRGVSLLLVGHQQGTYRMDRMADLLARPNVQWVGGKPFEELPSYLQVASVGLTPYADSPFNRASFPLKTLEYLAAGRYAVSTDLPAVRQLDTDLITVAATPEAFADATEQLLTTPIEPDRLRRSTAFASVHSWDARVADVAAQLGLSHDAGLMAGR